MRAEPLPTREEMRRDVQIAFKTDPDDDDIDELIEDVRRVQESEGPIPAYAYVQLIPLLTDMFSVHLEERTWHLLKFPSPMLLTGDGVVAMHDRHARPEEALGIDAEEIFMPIDPCRAIFLLKGEDRDGLIASGNAELSRLVNHAVATQSMRWIVHHPDMSPLAGLPNLGVASSTLVPR